MSKYELKLKLFGSFISPNYIFRKMKTIVHAFC